MSVGAKELESIRDEVIKWYAETRLWLIERLEEDGYPYGAILKSEEQQLLEFMSMQQEDWQMLFSQFQERYRGLPDAYARAVKDIESYREEMLALHEKMNTQREGVIYG